MLGFWCLTPLSTIFQLYRSAVLRLLYKGRDVIYVVLQDIFDSSIKKKQIVEGNEESK